MTLRWDETWHRLLEWTNGQGPSERLAAQVLSHEGYTSIDPSHPLGGKDGEKDAICQKDGQRWVMAVYFPRGQQHFTAIKKKFCEDLSGVASNNANAFVFVTNQEIKLAERSELSQEAGSIRVELFHLERITAILDTSEMSSVRKQFLNIDFEEDAVLAQNVQLLKTEVEQSQRHLASLQTGGDTFCYWMLYDFDMTKNVARNFVVIREGKYPLYDVRLRIRDMDANKDLVTKQWGELNSPADYLLMQWPLPESVYYRIFFHARNGSWNQDLQLRKSASARCWLAASRVLGKNGSDVIFEHTDNHFIVEFGTPIWRS